MLPFIGCVSSSYFSRHFFNFPRHTECMTIPLSAPVEKIEIIRLFGATNTNRKNREQILLPFQCIITWLYFLCYSTSCVTLTLVYLMIFISSAKLLHEFIHLTRNSGSLLNYSFFRLNELIRKLTLLRRLHSKPSLIIWTL